MRYDSANQKAIVKHLLETGAKLKAVRSYEKELMKYPGDLGLLYDVAMFYHEHIDARRALDFYDQIIEYKHDESGAIYGKAIILEELGEVDDAIEHYLKAIAFDPMYYEAHIYVADLWEQKGEFEKAEGHYQIIIAIQPENPLGFNHYGTFLERLGRDDEALLMFNRALEIFPNYDLAMFNKAIVQRKKGKVDEAIDLYEKVMLLSAYPYAYLNLAIIYKEQNDFNSANDVLSQGILNNPTVSVLYYNRAIMRGYLEKKTEAVDDVKKSIDLSPSLKPYALEDRELSFIKEDML